MKNSKDRMLPLTNQVICRITDGQRDGQRDLQMATYILKTTWMLPLTNQITRTDGHTDWRLISCMKSGWGEAKPKTDTGNETEIKKLYDINVHNSYSKTIASFP